MPPTLKAQRPRKQGHTVGDTRRVNEGKLVVKNLLNDSQSSQKNLKAAIKSCQRLDKSFKSLEDILGASREVYESLRDALNALHLGDGTSSEDESDHGMAVESSIEDSDSESEDEDEDESSDSSVPKKRGRNTRRN